MNMVLTIGDVLVTILCLGLNRLIKRMHNSRWAKFVFAAIVVNEIRGLMVFNEVMEKAGGWAGLLAVYRAAI